MSLIINFDTSFIASQLLYIFQNKFSEKLSLNVRFQLANICFSSFAMLWIE